MKIFDSDIISGQLMTFSRACIFSEMIRKGIVQSCDTQCTEVDCDVILIKNQFYLIIMDNS